MRHILTILAALFLCAPAFGQTVKALSYGTNGQFITGTNVLIFTNSISLAQGDFQISESGMIRWGGSNRMEVETYTLYGPWNFDQPAAVRANLGFSTNLNTLWTATSASNARSAVGLGATWLTNTNVTNFRTAIGLGEQNAPRFVAVAIGDTNISFESTIEDDGINWYFNRGTNASEPAITIGYLSNSILSFLPVQFQSNSHAATTRTNLGLGATNAVTFAEIGANFIEVDYLVANSTTNVSSIKKLLITGTNGIEFNEGEAISGTRTNLGLGSTNIVTFAGLTNNGDIRINQTTPTNGLLFVYRTNNEPFLGLANLIASNNTTVSNETLFRVGVAEATNRSAQFGFRATNTNGNGVAVFSVFGFNALMQIGADASTNAVIYSGGGTNNEVMTLIRDGATEFARPLRFSTNASTRPSTNAPANTTNVAAWVEIRIGTNSYRVPLYQ